MAKDVFAIITIVLKMPYLICFYSVECAKIDALPKIQVQSNTEEKNRVALSDFVKRFLLLSKDRYFKSDQ